MISENQFMNFNDRVDYLQELSDKLFGVEYYLNDFVSTGIMYYDLLDMYNVKIGDKTYNCLMLNDEQDITQGLEENIYTERPEKSETDYTKADKTDRKINQTYIIVDKQNQEIDMVVSNVNNITNTKGEAEGKNIHLTDSAEEPLIDIMLEGESTQNGTPTPDNPIEIENIEGKNKFSGFIKGIAINATDGHQLANETRASSDYIAVDFNQNPNYYLSGLTNTLQTFVAAYNSNKEFLGRTGAVLVSYFSLNSSSFTLGTAQGIGDIAYLRVTTYENTAAGTTGAIDDVDNLETQLEAGTVATTYVPYHSLELKVTNGLEETDEKYQEQVVTFPLGEEKLMEGSYLDDDGVHNVRKQVVLDGSDDEGWSKDANQNNSSTDYFYIRNIGINTNNIDSVICNYFKKGSSTVEGFWATTVFCITINKTATGIVESDTKDQRVAKWKTWLSKNPITVEYELAEEEIVPYTTAQQEAWNNIRALMTYKNVTNISSDAYAKIIYVRDNGLDVYETKSSARQTKQQVAQQKITIDQILSRVSEIEDFSREVEGIGYLHLIETAENEGLVINLKIKGNTNKFKTLVPRETLVPSESLVPYGDTITIISDTSTALTENAKEYTIPIGEPLRNNGTTYDELSITSDGTITITRRISSDGSILTIPTTQVLEEKYPIFTFKNDTYLYIRDYPDIDMYCKYVIDSDYIETFATQGNLENAVVELDSEIKQTASEINLEVSKKVGNDEIISKINQTAEAVTIDASKININGTVSANGNFKVDRNGNMECNNAKFYGGNIELTSLGGVQALRYFANKSKDPKYMSYMTENVIAINNGTAHTEMACIDGPSISVYVDNESGTHILHTGITTPVLTQTSLESIKKNFEEVENATSIVKNSEVYKYNLKTEEDTDKKHYGFVIGENYNTPDEVISKTGDGIDTYSMCSILWKAVQEQQEQIETLQQEINKLKGENYGEN